MSQTKQLKKAKLYRALKIVFYTLGLPLFFFAVICTAIKFIGEDPFVGLAGSSLSSGIYVGYERFINSPALYGIWCALAVWVFIVICHAIVSKAFKGFRTRLFSMLAIILVVMLGTMGIMDAAFSAKIDKIDAKAPAGVTVQDYKTQLSYYDYVSYYRKDSSLINQLMSQVQHLEEVYHVEWQGIDKSGEAGNIANKPVTYKNIIDDEGNVGAGDKSDALVEVAPKNGKLVIDGKTYNGYFCITRTGMTGTTVHVWYSKDMLPVGSTSKKGAMKFNTTDGVYGEGLYNESGLLSDGWVFSFENVIEILEDYYAGQQFLATADQTFVEEIKNNAEELRKAYYAGTAELPSTGKLVDPRVKALYEQEVEMANNFSMPRARLEEVVSYLGAFLGDNHLFDYLLDTTKTNPLLSLLNTFLTGASDLPTTLANGISLTGLLNTVGGLLKQPTLGATVQGLYGAIFDDETLEDVFVKVTYKTAEHNHLYLALYGDNGEGAIDNDKLLADVDFTDGLLADGEDGEYNFDLDRLSTFLSGALNRVVEEMGFAKLIDTIGGLVFTDIPVTKADGTVETYKGLEISGISIPLINAAGEFDVDVNGILTDLLAGLYNYQSPVIKPIWEFYTEAVLTIEGDLPAGYAETAQYLADYERAYYEGAVVGNIVGSTLIGDTIGTGAYPAAVGLTDLASVQQLKTDLSYQPKNFPLYKFRDMLLTSSGIVIIFYLLYMIAAEKEKKYFCLATCDGDAEPEKDEKKPNAFVASVRGAMDKVNHAVDGALEKAHAGVGKAVDGFKQRTGWDDKKTSLASKILSIILYVVAFLPLIIIPIVLAAKTCQLLPSYSIWHFIGFIVMAVFAIIFALVVVLVSRKKSKKSIGSQGVRIAITYVCLTTVFGLILTYVLPDIVANATSYTIWSEDIYYNGQQQAEENAALERQYVAYNLLNGNMNIYDPETGELAEHGDFSYAGLEDHPVDAYPNYSNAEIYEKVEKYTADYATLALFNEHVESLDPLRKELYNWVFDLYVCNDADYALPGDILRVRRHALALAITDYLFDHANYAKLAKQGLGNAKLKQLFANNYDSFNQDGYKTFDDSMLLFAQMEGRMTTPVIVRLILNKNWTYTQASRDAENGNRVYFEENDTFLYEIYDPTTVNAFKENGGTFTEDGTLVNGNGKKYNIKYAIDENGWELYANGVVRRPLNWLVLDMLGDPMDLTAIELPESIKLNDDDVAGVALSGIFDMLGATGVTQTLNGVLKVDLPKLVEKLASGAGLGVGLYLDDNNMLNIRLMSMNTVYGMLGYMQASWIQSNGLLMAVINLLGLRNYLYIFGGIGIVLIILATILREAEKYANERIAAAPAEPAEPTAPEATEETAPETPAEQA